jgi:hypothetical protein
VVGDTLRLPKNEQAVYIDETGGSRGLGVFALQDIALRRRVIHEYYVLSCNLGGPLGMRKKRFYSRDIASMWDSLSVAEKDRLKQRFWKLRFIPSEGKPGYYATSRLKNFLREYGFFKAGGQKKVLVYRVASRINHACSACANAEWVVDSSDCSISIRVTRHMKAGEEILIHYGRTRGDLKCCICESMATKEKIGSTWDRFLRWSSRLFWHGNEEKISRIENQVIPPSSDEVARLISASARDARRNESEEDAVGRSGKNRSLVDAQHRTAGYAKTPLGSGVKITVDADPVQLL